MNLRVGMLNSARLAYLLKVLGGHGKGRGRGLLKVALLRTIAGLLVKKKKKWRRRFRTLDLVSPVLPLSREEAPRKWPENWRALLYQNLNLPQQGKLGAPAAGVVGIIVPGAPTSLSNKGPTEVSMAGTSVERATADEEEANLPLVASKDDSFEERFARIKELVQDVNRNLSVDMGDVPLPESFPDCPWESVTAKEKKVSKSKVDFKEELDDITYEQLLNMGATNTKAMGLEMLDVIDSIRANSSLWWSFRFLEQQDWD
ncbi:atp-dependent dna ligase [Lasius niger]|uniref:Atp-dependent dna ligase n=1 Tax=Lasius niger TaxID=67767 RepID=A0A0J7KL37_LASNI|nr:atp-dependent dna ligase [Lasius niger]